MSVQFFLFSILTNLFKNMLIETNAPINTPAKWNLYPYGDRVLKNPTIPEGKDPLAKIDVVNAPSTYIDMIKSGNR